MLILTRKPGESLYIGDDIKISIVELKGHQIRIGIEAPKECRVYREEIYLAIMEENKSAAVFDTETEKLPKAQIAAVRPVAVKPRALSGLSVRRKADKVEAKEAVAVKSESSVVVRRKRPKKNDE